MASIVHTYLQYVAISSEFLTSKIDRLKLLREGLRRGDIAVTLTLASSLNLSELSQLLPELVLFSTSHGYARKARELILSLPKEWLLEHIESISEPILQANEEEDFWRILELYFEIDPQLTENLAKRAINHSDEYIREAGQYFWGKLSTNSG